MIREYQSLAFLAPLRLCAFELISSIFAGVSLWSLSASAEQAPPEPPNGQALVELIRNGLPEETNASHGKLLITVGGQTRTIPFICHVLVHDDSWEMDYDTSATADTGAEQLIIIHRPNTTNEYLYARAPLPSAPVPKPAPISSAEAATTPLAGSDFSAADLGLDFLHWPQQDKKRGERHLDRECYVLESRDPAAKSIVFVKSYIDKETAAPLIANAYDADGHTVKVFSLHGSSFKKVNGHWRLENMEIKDKKKKSQTVLKFDIHDP